MSGLLWTLSIQHVVRCTYKCRMLWSVTLIPQAHAPAKINAAKLFLSWTLAVGSSSMLQHCKGRCRAAGGVGGPGGA